MRPWTEELLKQFPLVGVLSERPWWRWDVKKNRFHRSDQVRVIQEEEPGSHRTRWAVGGFGSCSSLGEYRTLAALSQEGWVYPPLDLLAEIDRIQPLPHPGYRIGQIWALANGRAFTIQEVDSHGEAFVLIRGWGQGEPVDSADPSAGKSYPARLFPLPRKATFLITDPCCPHLAPWSTPETDQGLKKT